VTMYREDITEATEACTSMEQGLWNLREQVITEQPQGVIDMYELAALVAGATVDQVETATRRGRETLAHTRR